MRRIFARIHSTDVAAAASRASVARLQGPDDDVSFAGGGDGDVSFAGGGDVSFAGGGAGYGAGVGEGITGVGLGARHAGVVAP